MMRKIIALLLSLALVFSLAACGDSDVSKAPEDVPGTEPSSDVAAVQELPADDGFAKGRAAASADSSFVVRSNNLKYRTYTVTSSDGNENSSYMQFYGMKDTAVEDSINNLIRHTFEDLIDEDYVSPYPGLSEELSSRGLKSTDEVYVGMTLHANYNDILSVSFFRNQFFNNGEDDYLSTSDARCFNFDLNTGKQIKLKDLVYDGADPEFFNDKVREALAKIDGEDSDYALYEYGYRLEEKTPFTGIEDDQKFYIDEYSGYPVLVFDYDTPEFETFFTNANIYVDTRGISAAGQRFVSDASLYENEDIVYQILTNDLNMDNFNDQSRYYDSYFDDRNISCSVEYGEYPELPEHIRSYLEFDELSIEETMNEVRDLYDLYTPAYPEGLQGNVWMYTYPSRIGEFINVDRECGQSLWTTGDYMSVYSSTDTVNVCFRGDSEEPLTLDGIFRDGTDRNALIKNAFAANAKRYDYDDVRNEDPEKLEAFYDAMLESINGFCIFSDSITFSFGGEESGIAYSFFPDSENRWEFSTVCSSVRFEDIGCENLNIFD